MDSLTVQQLRILYQKYTGSVLGAATRKKADIIAAINTYKDVRVADIERQIREGLARADQLLSAESPRVGAADGSAGNE